MNYEKEYDVLMAKIEAVKKDPRIGLKDGDYYNGYVQKGIRSALDYLLQEESEDERIRKMLIEQMERWKKCAEDNNVEQDVKDASDAIAYLKKQKEQKPAGTSNIDLDTKVNVWVGYTLNDNAQSYSRKDVQIMLDNCARYFYDYAVMCLDKPAEWSEEDENMIRFYEMDYNNQIGDWPAKKVVEMRLAFKDWLCVRLKSLRPQPHWKPSKEQIEALWKLMHSAVHLSNWNELEKPIEAIYNGLKKL